MAVNVIDEIVPKNSGSFPVARDTNIAGGWRAVADMTARNNIPTQRRSVGMRCYVVSTGKLYALIGGTSNGNWMEVQEGSITIASGRVDCTTSPITMELDFTNGVSPPAGVIVHNQAEYDALGAPLKYFADVNDVLPLGIGHPCIVTVQPGTYLNKPNDIGFGSYSAPLWTKQFVSTADKLYDVADDPAYYIKSIIIFKGAGRNVLYSGSGTAGGRGYIGGITPGGMTPEQYVGKLVIFTSGANAGYVLPIRSNGADTIFCSPSGTSAGACTFDIFDPNAVFMDSDDGVVQGLGAGLGLNQMNVRVEFDNIRFGTAAIPFSSISAGSNTIGGTPVFQGCMMDLSNPYSSMSNSTPGLYLEIFSSVINLHSGCSPIHIYGGAFLYSYDTLYMGSPSGSMFTLEGGYAYVGNCMVLLDDSFTGNAISLTGSHWCNKGENWMWSRSGGDGTDASYTAFSIYDLSAGLAYGPSSIGGYYFYVGNARAIIRATDCPGAMVYFTRCFIHSGANNAHVWELNYASIRTTGFTNGDSTTGLVSDIKMDQLNYSFSQVSVPVYGGTSQGTELIGQYGSHLYLSAG